MNRPMNRLWVRFAAAITGLILLVTILPSASLLLVDRQVIVDETAVYLTETNADAGLGLAPGQIHRLAESLSGVIRGQFVSDVQFLLLTTIIVGLVAGGLLGWSLSLPIKRLAAAAKAVGARDLSHRVEVKGAQEIQALAGHFNEMTAALAHAEQLRQNMLADVSHELLTPLTVLQGNLRAILDDVYELNKDEIARLYAQNQHLIKLVQDLRQLAQAEAGQLALNKVPVAVDGLVAEVTAVFTPLAAEKNITLTTDFAADLPPIHADPDRLRQALHNLLANALRHTPPGGEIHCSVIGEQYSVIGPPITDYGLLISVSDTGDGIPPEQLPHIFDRFTRMEDGRRRDSGGAGLGLAIAKVIVVAHDGRLTASSPGKGQGSTFTIHLPVS